MIPLRARLGLFSFIASGARRELVAGYVSAGVHELPSHHHHHHHLPGARQQARWCSSSTTLRGGNCDLEPLAVLDDVTAVRAAHSISDYTNWLIPGRVMLGRYPGSGRGQTVESAIRGIREKGVDTFVCLQSELPPADSGLPLPSGFEPYAEIAKATDGPVPVFVYFAMDDMQPADDLEKLAVLVEDLAARILDGKILYIHCWGGKGRTGLVAACLLTKLFGIDATEALLRLQAYIEVRVPNNPGIVSPETDPQREQVRAYYEAYGEGLSSQR